MRDWTRVKWGERQVESALGAAGGWGEGRDRIKCRSDRPAYQSQICPFHVIAQLSSLKLSPTVSILPYVLISQKTSQLLEGRQVFPSSILFV
ncbi:hypothetical protein BB560_004257, partial [Smittium megazygosporum]